MSVASYNNGVLTFKGYELPFDISKTTKFYEEQDVVEYLTGHLGFQSWLNNTIENNTINDIENIKAEYIYPFGKIESTKRGFVNISVKFSKWSFYQFVFIRGDAVSVLVHAKIDGVDKYFTTVQARAPTASFEYEEIIAGMLDKEDSVAGVAITELQEEAGIVIANNNKLSYSKIASALQNILSSVNKNVSVKTNANNDVVENVKEYFEKLSYLNDNKIVFNDTLTEEMLDKLNTVSVAESLIQLSNKSIYPSAGGCDEALNFYYASIGEINGNKAKKLEETINGNKDEDEDIKLKLRTEKEILSSSRDMKAFTAFMLLKLR